MRPAPGPPAANAGAPASGNAGSGGSPGTATAGEPTQGVIEVAGERLVITLADARALQAALLEQLARSSLADQEQLSGAARAEIQLDPQRVRIGRWELRDYGGKLTLYLHYSGARFFRAQVRQEAGGWSVEEPTPGEIFYMH